MADAMTMPAPDPEANANRIRTMVLELATVENPTATPPFRSGTPRRCTSLPDSFFLFSSTPLSFFIITETRHCPFTLLHHLRHLIPTRSVPPSPFSSYSKQPEPHLLNSLFSFTLLSQFSIFHLPIRRCSKSGATKVSPSPLRFILSSFLSFVFSFQFSSPYLPSILHCRSFSLSLSADFNWFEFGSKLGKKKEDILLRFGGVEGLRSVG
ncbi:hypothetical protein COLO4_04292 [Corchorus olitorius]|uniref:Uncharacterized protein n=1 Tax=Corchorus olitorius TaxID=93759 RepID=A0A1R3KUK4_9ROSI|nr:hypothetical protein COLO4_04292 [Corchorus olitorius]